MSLFNAMVLAGENRGSIFSSGPNSLWVALETLVTRGDWGRGREWRAGALAPSPVS